MGRTRGSAGRDLLKGAIAGAVATWVMDRVTTAMYRRENPAAKRAENEVRGGQTAYETAAGRAAELVGAPVSDQRLEQAGLAVHWALGIGAGAVYAVLRRRVGVVGRAAGTVFGTGFWALLDEGVVPLLGLTPGPRAFPWQTHARGLAGHLSFGAVTDATLRVLDAVV
ncbi:MAG: DUF1440 domain-containing protein [Nocardioidaceae bacterium]